MRILFVSQSHLDSNSGIHIYNLANQIKKLGGECVVCVPEHTDAAKKMGEISFEVILFEDALQTMKLGQYDLIHAWTPREHVRKVTQQLSTGCQCPYVVHLEDNEESILEAFLGYPMSELNGLPQRYLDAIVPAHISHPLNYKEFLSNAQGVTVIMDTLLDFCPSNIHHEVIWAGFEDELNWHRPMDLELRHRLGIDDQERVLVYTGNVHQANRQEVSSLYLAVGILNRSSIQTRLIRTGRDQVPLLSPTMEKIIRKYCVELEWIPRKQLPALLSIADVLVQPGKSNVFNAYRFPSKLPEYLATGKPVLLPDTNIGRFLKDGEECILLAEGDALEISEKLKVLFSDNKLSEKIGRGGRRFAEENLKWSASAKKLYDFYEQVLSKEKRIKNNILVAKASHNAELPASKADQVELNADLVELKADQVELNAELCELKAELVELNAELVERDIKIQAFMEQVTSLNVQLTARDQQISNIKKSNVWKLASAFHRIRILIAPDNSLRKKILQNFVKFVSLPFVRVQSNRNVEKKIKLIRSSGLFDETWYLLNNPDVANTKIDPARHYMLFGGFEGRDPGPNFNSSWYLDSYQDVKRAKINPLVHYLLFGSREGRVAYPSQQLASYDIKKEIIAQKKEFPRITENKIEKYSFLIRKAFRVFQEQGFRAFLYKTYWKINELIFGASKPVIVVDLEQKYDAIPIRIPNKIEKSEQLSIKFQQYLINDKYVISISHDNYINNTGGVQIRISDEQIANNSKGISYLHLYPNTNKPTLAREGEAFFVGINCDGINIGISDSDELLMALKQLGSKNLIDVYIHHTMGFDIHLLYRILGELGNKKGRFWLHDYFSLCPGYNLLYNDHQYCGAPNINSNACLVCIYGITRRKQQSAFIKLFEDYQLEVVAPSSYALALWKEKFPVPVTSEKVISLATMKWGEAIPRRKTNNPLRIGFVGYPVYHKGWETWLRLVNQFSNDNRYKFFLFSNTPLVSNKYKRVNVTVAKDKRFSMVKALRDNQIDVALLWSPWPETFSFTLYESLAAGCYILTYKDSGNIQNYLMENANRGSILEDEQALFKLFSSNILISNVVDYQRNGKPQAELGFLPEPE